MSDLKAQYESIMKLLKSLSDGQKKRLLKCIHIDEGLLICVGKEKNYILTSLSDIDSILTGAADRVCAELQTNEKFASSFKSAIYRIIAPEDCIMNFLDFRSEHWPEE